MPFAAQSRSPFHCTCDTCSKLQPRTLWVCPVGGSPFSMLQVAQSPEISQTFALLFATHDERRQIKIARVAQTVQSFAASFRVCCCQLFEFNTVHQRCPRVRWQESS